MDEIVLQFNRVTRLGIAGASRHQLLWRAWADDKGPKTQESHGVLLMLKCSVPNPVPQAARRLLGQLGSGYPTSRWKAASNAWEFKAVQIA